MRKFTPKALFLFLLLLPLCEFSHGQDIPAVTSAAPYQIFSFPETNGSLSYSLNVSESARIDFYGGGNSYATGLSGNVGYLSKSSLSPLSISYSGGTSFSTTTSSSQPFTYYQSLNLAKDFTTRFARFSFSDSVSYLPNAASGGLSGFPDGGAIPINPAPSQDIITSGLSSRVSNSATAGATHNLTANDGINASGSYTITRFVGTSTGFNSNTDQISGSAGLNHRIDGRSSANLGYTYSNFNYPGNSTSFSFVSQSLSVGYSRNLTRRLAVNASGGPQRTSSSSVATGAPTYNFSGSGSINYASRLSSTSLSFSRGVGSGSGVVQGALSTSVSLGYGRSYGRAVHLSSSASYTENSSIPTLTTVPFSTKTISASVQGGRSIGRYVSANLSYYLVKQLADGTANNTNAFNGLSQVISFGISYTPRPIQVGHQ